MSSVKSVDKPPRSSTNPGSDVLQIIRSTPPRPLSLDLGTTRFPTTMPRKSLIEEFLDAGAGLLDELFGEEDASSVAACSRNAAMSAAFEDWYGRS